MQGLGLDVGLLLSQMVNFGLLVLILYLVLYKPVLRKLEERANRIRQGLEDADDAERLKAEAEQFHEAEMDRARREAREVIERATHSAEQLRQEILAQARQDAHDLAMRAEQQAERRRQESEIAWRQQTVDLAIAAASRVLQQELDEEKHHALVAAFIEEMSETR